jgi:hypothetical protein
MRGSRYRVGQVSTFAHTVTTPAFLIFCDEISRLGDKKKRAATSTKEFLEKKAAFLDSDKCLCCDGVRHLAAKNTCLEASRHNTYLDHTYSIGEPSHHFASTYPQNLCELTLTLWLYTTVQNLTLCSRGYI